MAKRRKDVDLLRVIDLLQAHITPALCRTVFGQVRYIRWRRGGTRYELLTNVLAPARLSAEEALDLYPYHWGIERMWVA
jgi:hypothetical protein